MLLHSQDAILLTPQCQYKTKYSKQHNKKSNKEKKKVTTSYVILKAFIQQKSTYILKKH